MQDEECVRRERGVLERCSCDGSKKKSVSCLCEQAVVVASTGDDVDCGG